MPYNKSTDIGHKKNLATYSLFFLGGFAIALAIVSVSSLIGHTHCVRQLSSEQYHFITPQVPCDVQDKVSANYNPQLKGKLQNYIDMPGVRKLTKHVSVYYYNFKDGSWFGINEDEKFAPASLLKVPILISIMKESEVFPNFLSRKIKYEGIDTGLGQYYPPGEQLNVGQIYTVGELAEIAIKYSNNEASYTLFDFMGEDKVFNVYRDIGIPLPGKLGERFISVREYMSFFKTLFDSSYLSHTSSEKILGLLTETTFKDGIVAGVPENIKVAHKFGERIDEETEGLQLHDCGIVYAPGNPYLLCVMTRGDNFENLSKIIKKISEIIYTDITK